MPAKLYTKGRKGRTIEQKLEDQVKAITKLRAVDAAKKKKGSWVSRLKKSIAALKGPGHSPAGKKYIAGKGKKIAYYGQKRETADAILRRLKRRK